MGECESNSAKPRARPIVRLGIFLVSHSNIVSVVCFVAGVVALLLLPVLAKNTYISENALMPGSANNMLSTHHASDATKFVKDLTNLGASPIESQKLIAQYMSALDAEVTFHKFYPQLNHFHPLHFFTSADSGIISENATCSSFGINTVGIIRAPRGDGKEAIVLVTPYNPKKVGLGEAFSLGIAYSVVSLLSRVTWLAKDIVWLVADSQYGEYSAVAAWLREYQAPVFRGVEMVNSETCNGSNIFYELGQSLYLDGKLYGGFRRAGTMAAALVIKVADQGNHYEDSLNIYAEASNGQMPNLDLINIVNYLAVHKQGLRIKVKKMWSLVSSRWLNTLGVIFESLGQIARSLNPQWKFGIPATEYVEGAATLASSLYYQGLGVPTGPHGAFRDYQVDAITLEISPKVSLTKMIRRNEFILRGGRLVEGVIRSINNLLEKFHQSFFLYLLTSPSKFVSVGVYMIPFALLVAPLPIVAAYLHADASKCTPQATSAFEVDASRKSWKWLNSARKVLVIHLWGVIVSLLPYFLCRIPNTTPTTNFMLWGLLSGFSLLILYLILGSASQFEKSEWTSLKSVTISTTFIGLSLMSVINFATAEIGALFIVPICLMARPLKLDTQGRSWRTLLRATCNLALGLIGFPPVAFVLLKGAFEDSYGINVGDYWNWLESLWAWNSATYLYVGVVHLPCWALCIHILFHRC
ncbi:glycosylphosphatidylinositol anchor attachment 1 protein [Abrus precatorius]|uniref:Glycosylphosphatidylinositol anchor attachment 1 protein n=1 Tax=Abrus precatorius TaxID=3816 RepID=A0A8B8LPZ8_ABRPR|nr:glycosylphosphatidylinositol anchor attachment 1 protein [Abrus precatorius]